MLTCVLIFFLHVPLCCARNAHPCTLLPPFLSSPRTTQIAAANTGAGIVGVAPGTAIYAVKVLDDAGKGSW